MTDVNVKFSGWKTFAASLVAIATPSVAQYTPPPVPPPQNYSSPAQKAYLQSIADAAKWTPMSGYGFPEVLPAPNLPLATSEPCYQAKALLPNPSASASAYRPFYLQPVAPCYGYSELRDNLGKRLYAVGIKYEIRYREIYMLGHYDGLSNMALYESMQGIYATPTSLETALSIEYEGQTAELRPRWELDGATYYVPVLHCTATLYYRREDGREEVSRQEWEQ